MKQTSITSLKIKQILLIICLVLGCQSVANGQIITTKKEAAKVAQSKKASKSNTQGSSKKITNTTEVAKKSSNVASQKNSNDDKKSVASTSKFKISDEAVDYVVDPVENYLAQQIIYNGMDFLGVRYRGGGTSRDGMDCSGFVTTVLNIFDIKIPRSSQEMASVGQKISKDEAKVGDLIFFKTTSRSRISHVGIISEIIGDEIKFIHSSTSLGVVISSLSEAYYKRTFTQINRILN